MLGYDGDATKVSKAMHEELDATKDIVCATCSGARAQCSGLSFSDDQMRAVVPVPHIAAAAHRTTDAVISASTLTTNAALRGLNAQ